MPEPFANGSGFGLRTRPHPIAERQRLPRQGGQDRAGMVAASSPRIPGRANAARAAPGMGQNLRQLFKILYFAASGTAFCRVLLARGRARQTLAHANVNQKQTLETQNHMKNP